MKCSSCGRDLDLIGQDNLSCVPGQPLCEDCAGDIDFHSFPDENEEYEYEEEDY